MSRQSIKLAALLISTALITSACAIGFNAPTNQQKASGNGRSANVDAIEVRGALVVIDPKKPGWGAFVGTIINTAPETDRFVGIELDPAIGRGAPNNNELKTQVPVQFGLPGQLSLPIKLNSVVKPGAFLPVQLDFQNNEAIPMNLLVENNDGIYSDVIVGSLIEDSPRPAIITSKN